MSILRLVLAYLAAVVVMATLGVVTQSLFVLLSLGDVGASIPVASALGMMVDDLLGLGPIYAILIAIGFVIAFPVAAIAVHFLPIPRALIYAAAGLVCIAVMLTLMKEVFFGVQLIAGARTLPGFWARAGMGAIAGLAFVWMTRLPWQAGAG